MQEIIISTVKSEPETAAAAGQAPAPALGYPFADESHARLHQFVPSAAVLLQGFARRWLLASLTGLVLAAAALAAAWHFFPPKYTAFALLRISSTTPHLVYRESVDSRGEFVVVQKTQAALVRSRFVLNAAMRKLNVNDLETFKPLPDPVAWLEEEIKVEFQDGSEIMRISLSGAHPQEITQILNAVKDAYLHEIVYDDRNKKSQQLYELEQLKNKTEEMVRNKKTALREFNSRLQTKDPAVLNLKQKNLHDQYLELLKEKQKAAVELKKMQLELQAKKEAVTKEPATPPSAAVVDEHFRRDPAAQKLLARIDALQARIDHYRSVAVRTDEPLVAKAIKDLDQTCQLLEQRKKEFAATVQDEVGARRKAELRGEITALESKAAQLAAYHGLIGQNMEQLLQDIGKFTISAIELDALDQEIKQMERISEAVADRIGKLQVEMPSPHRISPLQAAEVPKKRDLKKPLMVSIAATLAALVGGAGLISYGDFFLTTRKQLQLAAEAHHGLHGSHG